MKKAIRVCSILCAALLLVGIMSCGNVSGADSSEPDVWTKVTNLDDLKGTWEGSQTMTKEVVDGVIASIKGTTKVQYPVTEDDVPGLKMTQISDMTDYVEKSAKVIGGSADEVWQEMKYYMEDAGKECSDGRPYTISSTSFIPEDDILTSLTKGGVALFVNQSKTKLKLDYGDWDALILNKK